jgi:branched-chain amino acid transport system substrate-binding protein
MNLRSRVRRASALGAVVVAAALVAAACGGSGSGSSGGSGDPIKVGGMLSYTAAGSNSGPALEVGAKARFAQINEGGGVGGHQLEFVTADDALDPAKAPAAMRTLVESEEVVAVLGIGSADGAAVQPYLAQNSVLALAGGSSTPLINAEGSTYRLDKPTYDELAGRVVDYAVKTLGKQKIAVAYTPDAVGLPIKEGVERQLKSLGMAPVAEVEYSSTATNADAQAAQLKDSGADFVMINHVPSVMAKIFNSAERIGYKPTYGATFAGATPSLPQVMGDTLADRIYFGTSFMLPDSPEAADFRKYVEAQNGDIHDINTMIGWVNADAVAAVVAKAVQDNGGEVPTPEQVFAASSDITIDTPYLKDLTWTATDRTGPDGASITKLAPGGSYVEADAYKPNPFNSGA